MNHHTPALSNPSTPEGPCRLRRWRGAFVAAGAALAVVGCATLAAAPSERLRRPDSVAGRQESAPAPRAGRLVEDPVPSAWMVELPVEPTALLVSGPDAFVTGTDQLFAIEGASGRRRFSVPVPQVGAFLAASRTAVAVATDTGVAVFDRATGDPRWTVTLAPVAAGRQLAFVATDGGAVLVAATETGGLIAFDAVTGETRWTRPAAGIPVGALVAQHAHGLVVAMNAADPPSASGARPKLLRVIEAADGRVRWSRRFAAGTGTPVLDDERLMLITGRLLRPGRLRSFDVRTGAPGWSLRTEVSAEITTSGLVDGDRVIIGDFGGTFYAVRRRRGHLLWKTDLTRFYLEGAPVVLGETFVAKDFTGQYHVFDRRTGQLRGRWMTTGLGVGYGVAGGRLAHAQQGSAISQVTGFPDEVRTARTPQYPDRGVVRDDGLGRPATVGE